MQQRIQRSLAGAILLASALQAPGVGDVIRIKGSDTIGGRAMPEIAEEYRRKRSSNVGFQIDALGSATAFVGLFDGSADIGESSRPINEKELATARELGLKLQELVIGFDGVAVVVHPENPVKELTIRQLSDLFTGKTKNWRQVGGKDSPIRLISRPSYSGTQAFFREKAVRRGDAKGPEDFAPSTEIIEENGAILREVAKDPKAISYVGLGWLADSVKAVPVIGTAGGPAIVPSSETVRTGKYPLYRPLLMYVPANPKPATLDFLRFVLSSDGGAVMAKSGFIPTDASTPVPAFLAGPSPVVAASAPARTEARRVESAPAPAPVAAEPVAARAPGAPAPARPQREIVRVNFAFAARTVDSEGIRVLDDVARRMAQSNVVATITGHADGRGNADVNERVALARAHAVANGLLKRGVPAQRLRVEGSGADAPLATNDSDEGRARNRRVDIEMLAR